MKPRSIVLPLLVAYAVGSCFGERIVVLYPLGSKSHFYAVMPIIEKLVERGHNVTVFTPFKGITKNVKNVREVILESLAKKIDEVDIDWFAMQKQGATQFFKMMFSSIELAALACEELITNPVFRQIVETREVDLFIVDGIGNEFTYPVIDKLGVPFVLHGASSAFPATLGALGAPIDYASVPIVFMDFDDKMTFFQRLINFLTGELIKLVRDHFVFKKLDAILQREFPGVKPIVQLEGEASLLITNTHPITNWPRSLPPTIIPIAALHTRPAKQLPSVSNNFDLIMELIVVYTLLSNSVGTENFCG